MVSKTEKEYNCRNCDFTETAVFHCLSGDIQSLAFTLRKGELGNIMTM